jgi:hypothetical protein
MRVTLRVVAVITALVWLQLLSRGLMMYRRVPSVTNATMIAVVCLIIGFALLSVFRTNRSTAVALLIVSVPPACVFAYQLWSELHRLGRDFFAVRDVSEALWDCSAICFVVLPFLWTLLYLRLRREPVQT